MFRQSCYLYNYTGLDLDVANEHTFPSYHLVPLKSKSDLEKLALRHPFKQYPISECETLSSILFSAVTCELTYISQ